MKKKKQWCTIKFEENFCHFDGASVVEAGLLKCSWNYKNTSSNQESGDSFAATQCIFLQAQYLL